MDKLLHEQLAFWLETYNAWRRHDGEVPQQMPFNPKQLGEIIDQTIATLREDMAKLNTPTPREQELEAQNKALSAKVEVTKGVLDEVINTLDWVDDCPKEVASCLTLLKTLQDALKQ
jgi:hypothetical protein